MESFSLDSVPVGIKMKITKVLADEPIKSRLVSMGFSKGNSVVVLKQTMSKQTFDVRIEDSEVALRFEEAKTILVCEEKK